MNVAIKGCNKYEAVTWKLLIFFEKSGTFFGLLRIKTIILLKKELNIFETGFAGLGKNYQNFSYDE